MKVIRNTPALVDVQKVAAGCLFEYNGGVFLRTSLDVNTRFDQPLNTIAVNVEDGQSMCIMYQVPSDQVLVLPLEGELKIK